MKFLLDELIQRLSFKALAFIEAIFIGLTFTAVVDFTMRTASGLIAIAVGVVAWRNSMLRNKILKRQMEIEDQKLNEYLESRKPHTKRYE